jgi:preprotein translocase subunit SecA
MKLRYLKAIERIHEYIDDYRRLSDTELSNLTVTFKKRLSEGASLDSIMEEAYAAICVADERVLGLMPYDEQIYGAIALNQGYLAEMATGEGKTLMATMPLYLNALTGKSTILVTANEYLAIRDANEMGPAYRFMGLSCMAGVKENPNEEITNDEKREFYAADVLYTTHAALGFDYLFENLVKTPEDRFLREFYFIIIDEADMVLLDASQMPLVISGTPRVQSNLIEIADFFVSILDEEKDVEIENHAVWLTKAGIKYAEDFFGIDNFYKEEYFELNRQITLALRARFLFAIQKDYIISDDGEIILLDNGTGRSLPGMKLRGGMHQALEQKEKLEVSSEQRSMASITYQNLFLMFPKMTGMSGTMYDAKLELFKVYKKRVISIPTHKPCIRDDRADKYYVDGAKQFKAVIRETVNRHFKSQPVLIVTSTINDTKIISGLLTEKRIPHSVLNANNIFWESDIIKEAGRKGAVTVSTGLAGRGTDIKLEEGVNELGGLCVLGVGRMDNTRLERQVRGRAGRQGDNGMSQFYVSLEDEIVKFMGEKYVEKLLTSGRDYSQHKLKRVIDRAQRIHMDKSQQAREMVFKYDRILKRQRDILYDARNRLIDQNELDVELLYKIIKYNTWRYVKSRKHISKQELSRYVLDNLSYEIGDSFDRNTRLKGRKLAKYIYGYSKEVFDKKMTGFENANKKKEYVNLCVLKALDDAWIEEVDYLQQLQAAISGRALAQRNPVFEYSEEAYKHFRRMEDIIRENIMRNILLGTYEYDSEGKIRIIYP